MSHDKQIHDLLTQFIKDCRYSPERPTMSKTKNVAKQTTEHANEPATIAVELPVAELTGDGYFDNPPRGHVDAQLERRQAKALNRITRALDDRGDRLANGRRVQSRADAVRWILEQVELVAE